MTHDGLYMAMADAITAPPENRYMGVIDLRVPSLRCFRAYHKDGRWSTVLRDGKERWYTDKMMRVEAVALRVGTVGSGYTKTRDIAAEARVSPGYVSKMLHRFEAWGVIGVIRTRGRNGKLFIFTRFAGDRLDQYKNAAIAWLRQSKIGRLARSLRRGNVSFLHRNGEGLRTQMSEASNEDGIRNTSMEETFSGWSPFTKAVVHERARLAIEDRAGEADAVSPLSEERAWFVFNTTLPTHRPQTQTRSERAADFDQRLMASLGCGLPKQEKRVPCPAHGSGEKLTLAWWIGDDGRLKLKCWALCSRDDIEKAAGVAW